MTYEAEDIGGGLVLLRPAHLPRRQLIRAGGERSPRQDCETIAMHVSELMHCPLTRMLSRIRLAPVYEARMTSIAICRELTSASLEQIATVHGAVDHGTALHAVRNAIRRCDPDIEGNTAYRDRYCQVRDEVRRRLRRPL